MNRNSLMSVHLCGDVLGFSEKTFGLFPMSHVASIAANSNWPGFQKGGER